MKTSASKLLGMVSGHRMGYSRSNTHTQAHKHAMSTQIKIRKINHTVMETLFIT